MPVEYARQGDWYVAYASGGDGPHNVVFASNWMTDVESLFDVSYFRRQFEAAAAYSRVLWFDQLGTGHSDPITGEMPSVETFSETIGVVMDAAAIDRATLVAWDL